MKILIASLLLSGSFYIPILCQESCHVPGECQNGIQIDEQLAETYSQCQEFCIDNPDCQVFTHYESNSFCKLWYNCSGISTTCSQCFSGERDCPTAVCSQSGQCIGEFVDDLFVNSEDECLEACYNDQDCLWYTLNMELDNYCLLTSTCNPQSSTTHVFGQRECFQVPNVTFPSK